MMLPLSLIDAYQHQHKIDNMIRAAKRAARKGKLYRICAWCWPEAIAPNVTHGICQMHKNQILAQGRLRHDKATQARERH